MNKRRDRSALKPWVHLWGCSPALIVTLAGRQQRSPRGALWWRRGPEIAAADLPAGLPLRGALRQPRRQSLLPAGRRVRLPRPVPADRPAGPAQDMKAAAVRADGVALPRGMWRGDLTAGLTMLTARPLFRLPGRPAWPESYLQQSALRPPIIRRKPSRPWTRPLTRMSGPCARENNAARRGRRQARPARSMLRAAATSSSWPISWCAPHATRRNWYARFPPVRP